MGEKVNAREPVKGPDYEDFWVGMKELRDSQKETDRIVRENAAETDRQMKETDRVVRENAAETDRKFQETDRIVRENAAETDRQMKETDRVVRENAAETDRKFRETDRVVKELSKQIGGMHRTQGRLTEEEYSAKLWEKFAALGYGFTGDSLRKKFRYHGRVLAEVDAYFENAAYVMPAEIKTELTIEDVDEHLERIAVIRKYLDDHEDKRRVVGTVAGGIAPENVIRYAQKKGLYVVVQSGQSVELSEAPATFKAAEW